MVPELMYNDNLCVKCGLCVTKCSKGVHFVKDGKHTINFDRCNGCGNCLAVCVPEALNIWGQTLAEDTVMEQIIKDMDYYKASSGGVTFSGGEPLLQPDAVLSLGKRCHEAGINVYLDTCGYVSEDIFTETTREIDGFLYDIKFVDLEKHVEYTGVDNLKILSNFRHAIYSEKPLRLRMILIPDLTDTADNLQGIIDLSKECKFKGPVDIMPYHNMARAKYMNMGLDYVPGFKIPNSAQIKRVRRTLEKEGLTVTVQ